MFEPFQGWTCIAQNMLFSGIEPAKTWQKMKIKILNIKFSYCLGSNGMDL